MRKTRKLSDYLIEKLRDAEAAKSYLQVALEEYQAEHNAEALTLALHTIAKAQGGLSELAKRTNLNRQTLYRTLSGNGNPRLRTLGAILNGLGYRLSIEPLTGASPPEADFPPQTPYTPKQKATVERFLRSAGMLNSGDPNSSVKVDEILYGSQS